MQHALSALTCGEKLYELRFPQISIVADKFLVATLCLRNLGGKKEIAINSAKTCRPLKTCRSFATKAHKDQIAFNTLNGNIRIAPTNLNTNSIVSPTIRNGRRISQMIGNRKMATIARGQQTANRMHKRITARKTLIRIFFTRVKAKLFPI
jgi:hypothetical protein